MVAETPSLPLLRYRDGDADEYYEKPVTIVGTIVALNVESMTINQGRDATVDLYLEDFEDVLGGGDADLMMSILADAAEHEDVVRIVLSADALSYENEKQLERAQAA